MKQFLDIAGVKSEDEFYKKFPTEESFFNAYPAMAKQYGYGGQIASDAINGAAQGAMFGPMGALIGAGANVGVNALMGGYGNSKMSFAGGGQLTEFDGPTHAGGGINIGAGNEVEDGETEFENYIFSDRLGPNGKKGPTYADLSKRINKKYKMRETDKLAQQSKARELQALQSAQESDSKIQELRQSTQMAGGGYKKYAPGGPKQLPTLMNGIDFGGGLVSAMDPIDSSQPRMNIDFASVGPGAYGSKQDQLTTRSQQTGVQVNPFTSKSLVDSTDDILNDVGQDVSQYKPDPLSTNGQLKSVSPSALGPILNSIGPVTQLIGSAIGGPDKTSFERVKPNLVNYDPVQTTLERQANLSSNVGQKNIATNARTRGEYLGNVSSLNTSIAQNLNNAIANLKTQEQNINAGIKNQIGAQNAQIQMNEQIANDQNLANYRNFMYNGVSDLGNIGAGYLRDKNMFAAQELQNQRLLNTLNSAGFNFMFNSDGTMSYIPLQ